jgi:hypothetical protein
VVRLVAKLLVLLAVLLMPLGMAAPAAANQSASMSMPMQHCPEQTPKHDTKTAFGECTMACSAALPAADTVAVKGPLISCVPVDCPAVQRLSGLHPDPATPPPRRS